MAHDNDSQVLGLGAGSMQWVSDFKLKDKDGTVVFAVAKDGTISSSLDIIDATANYEFQQDLAVDGAFSVGGNTSLSGDLSMASGKKIDLSPIGAANAALKLAATSDTPTVAFTDDGSAMHAPTTAPAGFLKVLVGASARFIPFWA